MIDEIFYIYRFYYSFQYSESGSWISGSPLRTELDTLIGKYYDRAVLTSFFLSLSQMYYFPFKPVTLLRMPHFPRHPGVKVKDNLCKPHPTSLTWHSSPSIFWHQVLWTIFPQYFSHLFLSLFYQFSYHNSDLFFTCNLCYWICFLIHHILIYHKHHNTGQANRILTLSWALAVPILVFLCYTSFQRKRSLQGQGNVPTWRISIPF